MCNFLSLDRDLAQASRSLARHNLRFYAGSISEIMPSFAPRPVGFEPPGGYPPINPSVSRLGEQTVMIQRCFGGGTLDEYGNYHMMDVDPSLPRNHLLHLDEDLNVVSSAPILPPIDLPSPRFSEEGPIDLRLFAWRGELWCVGYIAEPTPGRRWLNQMLARIDRSGPASYCLADWRVLTPAGPRAHEKNWMPATSGDDLRFIYLCDPTRVLDDDAHVVSETVPRVAAEDFRGGSQAVLFDGGWLALIHQVAFQEARGRQ